MLIRHLQPKSRFDHITNVTIRVARFVRSFSVLCCNFTISEQNASKWHLP